MLGCSGTLIITGQNENENILCAVNQKLIFVIKLAVSQHRL